MSVFSPPNNANVEGGGKKNNKNYAAHLSFFFSFPDFYYLGQDAMLQRKIVLSL